jgi:hypothetical protein
MKIKQIIFTDTIDALLLALSQSQIPLRQAYSSLLIASKAYGYNHYLAPKIDFHYHT